jgi:ornithine cyclodeaminase/alanine dehydrogenase-like protein (mu-crystallin family)
VLLLTEEDVRTLLPMAEAVRLMREAFRDLAAGRALNQPRRRLVLPTRAVLHAMAGAGPTCFGTKIYSTHPEHGAHFLFLLYDAATAAPLALMEANHLGRIRTGAATAVAVELLSAPEADGLGLIGTGFQAWTQLEAVLAVRRLRRIRVWSRSPEKRAAFAARCREAFSVPIEAVATAREAVEGAPIVITATSAREPVLEAAWVAKDALVCAIGSNHPARRELPAELIWSARRIVVDSIEQARIESGDLLLALPVEQWHTLPLVELQEIAVRGRSDETQEGLSIFKSNGLGVEDVYAAGWVYERALEQGRGQRVGIYS